MIILSISLVPVVKILNYYMITAIKLKNHVVKKEMSSWY